MILHFLLFQIVLGENSISQFGMSKWLSGISGQPPKAEGLSHER